MDWYLESLRYYTFGFKGEIGTYNCYGVVANDTVAESSQVVIYFLNLDSLRQVCSEISHLFVGDRAWYYQTLGITCGENTYH